MNTAPKISVIVPIYKVEQYLNQCIDSIIAQTYINLEIILVNDGSPDNCKKICDEYAEKDTRIKVIHKKNGGMSDARNTGIEYAKGDYLTFIDSDDWVEPDMIELLYNNLIHYNADVSSCSYYMVYTNSIIYFNCSNDIISLNSEEAIKEICINQKLHTFLWGKLYKKNIFNNLRLPKDKHYEDMFIILDIFSLVNQCVICSVAKYYYRQRKGSITHTNNIKIFEAIEAIEKNLIIIKDKYPNIIEFGNARVLKVNLFVLSRVIFIPMYKQIPEYKKILSILRKNYKYIIKNNAFTRNEKIKIIAIKINIKLFKLIQKMSNWKKNKILFN